MSLPGYKRKTKAATWLSAFPVVRVIKAQSVKPRRRWRTISPRSPARQKIYDEIYIPMVIELLKENPKCAVYPQLDSEDAHHIRGRRLRLLTYKPFLLAVSRIGHVWIHSHPRLAQAKGWLAKPGEWGKQPSKE